MAEQKNQPATARSATARPATARSATARQPTARSATARQPTVKDNPLPIEIRRIDNGID